MELVDRRTFERFRLQLPLGCPSGNYLQQYHICAHDISATGMGVISDKELPPGSAIDISFHVPESDKELPAQGKVIWTQKVKDGFRVGVALERTGLMKISTILRFLNSKRA
jgi:hypothetical protein